MTTNRPTIAHCPICTASAFRDNEVEADNLVRDHMNSVHDNQRYDLITITH